MLGQNPNRTLYLFVVPALLALALALSLGACGRGRASSIVNASACAINRDQYDSFMPRLTSPDPVQVSIDPEFTAGSQGQQEAIIRAVEVWNDFSAAHRDGRKSFTTTSGRVEAQSVPTKKGDCDFDSPGDQFFHVVRINSDSEWEALGQNSSIPAVTMRCYRGDDVEKQIVLINTDHTDARQFMSIALHELGHSLGLDHSCSGGAGSDRYIACSKLNNQHPYFLALMYPIFRVSTSGSIGTTDIKQALRQNDSERAECLYKDL